MAQRAGEKSYFTFVKGLNTEASPFTFPENSSFDEVNFELLVNGARRRRLGMDYESGYSTASLAVDDTLQAITQHEWREAGGESDYNFVAIQTGRYVRFYNNDTVLSDGIHSQVIDLSTYKVSTATQAQQDAAQVDMASGKGYLFIVGKYMEPVYLSYAPSTDTITANTFSPRMREFTRVDDSLEINEIPLTLSDEHRFNLWNQGWNDARINTFFTTNGYYPSNAHIVIDGWTVNGSTGLRSWSAAEVIKFERGSSPAPNGSIVTNAFDTRIIYDANYQIDILSYTYDNPNTRVTINTTTVHGLITGDVVSIIGNSFSWDDTTPATHTGSWDGTYTVTVVDTDTFTIEVTGLASWASGGSSTALSFAAGTNGNVAITNLVNPIGAAETVRFESVAFYAGRVWFSGVSSAT